jgi:hypothetical protein
VPHFVDHQQPGVDVVTQGWHAAHPQSLAFAGRNLVADALAGDFTLKLRKRQQHVKHESAHGRGGVELLGDGHKGHALAFEHFHHLGKVGQTAGESVNFVDHHDVHQTALDVRQVLSTC